MDSSGILREYITKQEAAGIVFSDETEALHQLKLELFREDHNPDPSDDAELPTKDPPEEVPDELSTNGFLSLNTHDTSYTGEHIPRIETFAEDLQAAVNAVWPSRGRGRYNEVHVLLLSWEEDNLGVESEIQRLGGVFSNLYRFDVQEFKIPHKTPGKVTTTEVSKFLENDGPESLLIVYYAGHARLSHRASDPPIWAANDLPRSPTLPSGGVQQLFEEAESDVLLLFDSCHSSHPAINVSGQGVTEVVAACGFEAQAPAVGPHSFTSALIRELEESFGGPPLSVAELHSRMVGSLKHWKPGLLRDDHGNVWTDSDGRPRRECHKRRTPIHCFLTNETPYRSIMLSPLPARLLEAAVETFELELPSEPSTSPSPKSDQSGGSFAEEISSVPTSISEAGPVDSLRVLLAVRLEEDFFDADDTDKVRTWCEWLRNIPQGTRDVKVQGVYKSLSTLMIISMPAAVWNLLPNNGAYSFIGFVGSDNLAPGLPANEDAAALVPVLESSRNHTDDDNRQNENNSPCSLEYPGPETPLLESSNRTSTSTPISPDTRPRRSILRARVATALSEQGEESQTLSFAIEIDLTGKLSPPFFLGYRSGRCSEDKVRRDESSGPTSTWKDMSVVPLESDRERDQEKERNSESSSSRRWSGREEGFVRPLTRERYSSYEGVIRQHKDRERDYERENERKRDLEMRDRARERSGPSPVRGVGGRKYPVVR